MRTPRPPHRIEEAHLAALQYIHRIIRDIIARGVAPLTRVWGERMDEDDPTPLARSRAPRIWTLSNSQLKSLWPEIPPEIVREYAPWAVSYTEVQRLSGRLGSPAQLQERVRAAIELERAARPRMIPETSIVESARKPGAFRLRYLPESMAIFDDEGNYIPLPATPTHVSIRTISAQMDWITLALEAVVSSNNIAGAISETHARIEAETHKELRRIINIDLVKDLPELRAERLRWYQEHTDLITSIRDGLLGDARTLIREAHERGLRVEVLAALLKERYEVSESRAELIARDQVLKANGRLTRIRQENVGITQYTWLTSGDGRVRDSHRKLHNTVQSWANPPPVGGGRHEHPGGDYQCRCLARAIVPKWLTEGT